MLKEFREFAVKGNVLDMAVGIIVGGAFGTIVKSLVNDIIMPPIGLALGGIDFANFHLVLRDGDKVPGPYATLQAAQEAGAVSINYGLLLNNMLSFLIVSFSVFLMVKSVNRLRREEAKPVEDPTTKECSECMSEIPIRARRCPHCTSQLAA